MPKERPKWIDDLNVQPGDHVLAIISSEDDVSLISPYVAEGIERGDVCSIIASENKVTELKAGVGEQGVDVEEALEGERMLFIDPAKLGDEDGQFSMDLFLKRVVEFIDTAAEKGIKHIRNSGAMSWISDVAGEDDAIYLEARLNEIFENKCISGF